MKIIVKLNGAIIYKGEITSYIPPSFITSKEKGYISNLLALIDKGSEKEWIKLKDGTTITITTSKREQIFSALFLLYSELKISNSKLFFH